VIEATTTAYPGALKRIEISGSKGTAILEEEELEFVNRFKLVSDILEEDVNASKYFFEDWLDNKKIEEIILI